MTHPGMESLLAHVDGELPRAEHRIVAEHLTQCTVCTTAVAELRTTSDAFGLALADLDAHEPASWAVPLVPDMIRDDAADTTIDAVVYPLRPPASREPRGVLRRAAAILLITAAAGSAAVIGGRAILSQRADPPEQSGITAQATTIAAVSVAPVAGRISIALDGAHSASRVYVGFARTADVAVSVEGTAPHVTAADGRIVVAFANAIAEIRITLPQRMRYADITADGALLVTVRDGNATPAAVVGEGITIGSGAPIDR